MPANFSFIIPNVLAGSARPGRWADLNNDLAEVVEEGVTAVISLTEKPLPAPLIEEYNLEYLHLPILDYTPPSIQQIKAMVKFVDKVRKKKGATLIHCAAGVGRTGTMLACYLVKEGKTASEAMKAVREARPGSIETRDQEDIVRKWAKELAGKKSSG